MRIRITFAHDTNLDRIAMTIEKNQNDPDKNENNQKVET